MSAAHAETAQDPIVIAHRGASGYLPEHTLPAKALAHAMGADFIEQDVVLSKDGVPVVLHDIHLDATTDVAERFPDRIRGDGRYYAIDFTLAELRELRAHERRNRKGDAVYPKRFPAGEGLSGIPTLREEIAFIEGLNHSRQQQAGLYIEMKGSTFHREQGQDLPAAVWRVLKETGWDKRKDQVFLQSFEPDDLRYLRQELACELPLIQLIAENSWSEAGPLDYDAMRTDEGLREIAIYADGIGPWIMQLYQGKNGDGSQQLSELVAMAHTHGLLVHPYTFRADELPTGISSFEELHQIFFSELGIDGVFTDFPDLTRAFIDKL